MAITLEQLEEMFRKMSVESGWDTDAELLWGYFFTDPNIEKLRPAAEHLAGLGYGIVDIYPTDDGSTCFLHVEKVERHTPESLHSRNTEFYNLAGQFDLESYDGMDVGPVLKKR